MKKLRKIGGAFMLLIMLVMMVHNTFPHIHHQHERHSHDSNNGTHHSHQDETHHQENQNPSAHSTFEFLSFLLGNHAHSQQVVDNNLIVEKCVKEQNQNKTTKFFIEKADKKNTPVGTIISKKPRIPFLREFSNYYFVSSPLRGPPTLG
jgi:ABC-type Zn2+ transport system substrate-binding protein/surface adhesin